MNIIKMRQEQRERTINSIVEQIDKKLYAGEEIDYLSTVDVISLNCNCSRRIAREYLDLAIVKANARVENGKILDTIKLGNNKEDGEKKA